MGLEIISPGAFTSIQDKGRPGYLSQGFIESGACDKYSMAAANLFAGNLSEPELAVLEFTLKGGEIYFTSDEVIALAGADMNPLRNGIPVSMYRPVVMRKGDGLSLGMASKGLRTYLAVYGGVSVVPVLGSRSTDLKSCMGGLEGRTLKAGDHFESGKSGEEIKRLVAVADETDLKSLVGEHEPWFIKPTTPFRYSGEKRYVLLRTVTGPQTDAFTEEGRNTFIRNPYQLTADCDRMACRLNGAPVDMRKGADIISDGILEGSVQITSSGLPIVMLADHQTTGGYAKIATVISTDIPALAQLRPGEWVTFQYVTAMEAVKIARKENKKLLELKKLIETAIGRW
ncbi:MAG: biotin-dependent carboxyltransferase family protein [Lacrimispora sp.]|jgi:biotin-dependent carboxylase-like uncharacterized protein|nr:biotin-dependent carboxyltransferase family protein [Lacrimispora sp.]